MAKTWQVILATVAIFVAGLVTGGASAFGLVHWVAHHRGVLAGQGVGPFGMRTPNLQPQAFGPRLMRSFEDQLDLTGEQRGRIELIVQRTAWQLGRQRRQVQLESALEMEKMQDDVASVLTPDQREKFEQLIREQRARLQEVKARARQAPAEESAPAFPK